MTSLLQDRRIGSKKVKARLGLSDATLWRWCKDGRFPKPHYIGTRRAWWLTEIEAWEREQMARGVPVAPGRTKYVPVFLPTLGPEVDALGLLVAFPELTDLAKHEGLPSILGGDLGIIVGRDLLWGHPGETQALMMMERLGLGAASLRRIRDLFGVLRPRLLSDARREFVKCCLKAAIAKVVAEQGEVARLTALGGSPVPEELRERGQEAFKRRFEMERRLRVLEAIPWGSRLLDMKWRDRVRQYFEALGPREESVGSP